MRFFLFFLIALTSVCFASHVELGVDVFFREGHHQVLRGKRIGLVTNQTGVNRHLVPTAKLLNEELRLVALKLRFSPTM